MQDTYTQCQRFRLGSTQPLKQQSMLFTEGMCSSDELHTSFPMTDKLKSSSQPFPQPPHSCCRIAVHRMTGNQHQHLPRTVMFLSIQDVDTTRMVTAHERAMSPPFQKSKTMPRWHGYPITFKCECCHCGSLSKQKVETVPRRHSYPRMFKNECYK